MLKVLGSQDMRRATRLAAQCGLLLFVATLSWARPQQTVSVPASTESVVASPTATSSSYVLGPDDVIAIKALDADEISNASIRIDPSGVISLPLLGRVTASGLTVSQL